MSSTTYLKSTANFVLKLKYLVTFGDPPVLEDVELVLEDGVVTSIRDGVKGCGMMLAMPPLTDAHTHLELFPLRGMVRGRPFARWALSMARKRGSLDPDAMAKGVREGIYRRFREGVFYIGEISSFGVDTGVKVDLPVRIRFFIEYIRSFDPERLPDGLDVGVSPHALYSSRSHVLREVSLYSKKYRVPFSMHLFETIDEYGLFGEGKTLMEDLVYAHFGIKRDFSSYRSPLEYLKSRSVFEAYNPSFVHLVYAEKDVISEMERCGAFAVLCPSSNLYIEGKMPPVRDIVDALGPDRIGIGTDSPASGVFQSLWDEMRMLFLLSGLDPETILRMAVVGGRRAIGYRYRPLSLGDVPELVIFSVPHGLEREELFLYSLHLKGDDILGYTNRGKLVCSKGQF